MLNSVGEFVNPVVVNHTNEPELMLVGPSTAVVPVVVLLQTLALMCVVVAEDLSLPDSTLYVTLVPLP